MPAAVHVVELTTRRVERIQPVQPVVGHSDIGRPVPMKHLGLRRIGGVVGLGENNAVDLVPPHSEILDGNTIGRNLKAVDQFIFAIKDHRVAI